MLLRLVIIADVKFALKCGCCLVEVKLSIELIADAFSDQIIGTVFISLSGIRTWDLMYTKEQLRTVTS